MNESNKMVLTAVIGILIGLILGRLLWFKAPASTTDSESGYGEEQQLDATSSEQSAAVENAVGDDTEVAAPKETKKIDDTVKANSADSISSVSKSGGNRVAVEDQKAGKVAVVSVTADRVVWAVVRDNLDGKMGKILGAKHFGPGKAMVEIPLQRGTEASTAYFVVLQADNNGDLEYSLSSALKNEKGEVISAEFSAL